MIVNFENKFSCSWVIKKINGVCNQKQRKQKFGEDGGVGVEDEWGNDAEKKHDYMKSFEYFRWVDHFALFEILVHKNITTSAKNSVLDS